MAQATNVSDDVKSQQKDSENPKNNNTENDPKSSMQCKSIDNKPNSETPCTESRGNQQKFQELGATAQIKKEQDQLKTDSEETNTPTKSEVEELKQENYQLRQQLAEKSDENARVTTEMVDAQRKIASLKTNVKQLTKTSEIKDRNIFKLEEDKKSLEAKLQPMDEKVQDLENQIKKLKEELEKGNRDKEKDRKKLAQYARQAMGLFDRIAQYERDNGSYKRQIKDMHSQMLLLEASIRSTSNFGEEIEMLRRRNSTLGDKIIGLIRQCVSLAEQNEDLRLIVAVETRAKQMHERLHQVYHEKLMTERRTNERLERQVDDLAETAERAQAVINVVDILAQDALNGLEVVDPTIHDVEETTDDLDLSS